jgi:hypothetical protein
MKYFLLPFFIAFFLKFNGQVYTAGSFLTSYTDINPDVTIKYVVTPYTNVTYSVNMFGGSQYDLEFTAHGSVSSSGSSAYIKVTSLDSNVFIGFGRWDSVYVPGGPNWNVTKIAKPLLFGEQINAPGIIWDNTVLYFTDHSGSGGGNKNVNDWIGNDKYLGLKFQNGNMTAYGWIRVQCISEDTCMIKEFSASQITTAIKEYQKDNSKIYPNPVSNVIYIDISESEISDLKLSDALGREMKLNAEFRDRKIRIDLDKNLPEGCYFLQYKTDGISHVRKLVKDVR